MRSATILLAAMLGLAMAGARPTFAEEDDPDLEAAQRHLQLGRRLFEAHDYTKALAEFERARVIKPLPVLDLNIARCLERLDRRGAAITAYQRYLDGNPDPVEAEEARRRIQALADIIQRSDRPPQPSATDNEQFQKARKLYDAKDYAKALTAFEGARAQVEAPEIDRYIARCLDRLERYPEAIVAYKRFLASAPDTAASQETSKRIAVLEERVALIEGKPRGGARPGGAAATAPPAPEKTNRPVPGTPPPPSSPKPAPPPPASSPPPKKSASVDGAADPADDPAFLSAAASSSSPPAQELGESTAPPPSVASSPPPGAPLPSSPRAERRDTPAGRTSRSLVVPLAVGAAGLGVLAVGLGLALSVGPDFDALKMGCAPFCQHSTWEGLAQRALAGDVLVAVGGAALAADAVLWILRELRPTRSERQAWVAPTGNGIQVAGRFQ